VSKQREIDLVMGRMGRLTAERLADEIAELKALLVEEYGDAQRPDELLPHAVEAFIEGFTKALANALRAALLPPPPPGPVN
jgi:hypothetical protein